MKRKILTVLSLLLLSGIGYSAMAETPAVGESRVIGKTDVSITIPADWGSKETTSTPVNNTYGGAYFNLPTTSAKQLPNTGENAQLWTSVVGAWLLIFFSAIWIYRGSARYLTQAQRIAELKSCLQYLKSRK
jgi:LPXTG-motif cell wall-anchored protein